MKPNTQSGAASILAYAIFTATGICLVLPGVMLPLLLVRWSLSDQQAGVLFFLFFVGSSAGALASRGMLSRSIARGCATIAVGAIALALASTTLAFVAVPVYGLGLGIAMTSVSLLQSRRNPTTRTAQMARLNLTWALGACTGPVVLLRSAEYWSVQNVLLCVAAAFLLFGGLSLWVLPKTDTPLAESSSWLLEIRSAPRLLFVLVPLATGVESSAGGWLSTYSRRSGMMLGTTIGTVTCLWVGLLLSRLLQSQRDVARRSRRFVLTVSPWLMSAAFLLILMEHSGWEMQAGAFLLGMGVGPVYPLLLSLLLDYGEAGNIMFLGGGVGSSLLPMLTGVISGRTGSLAAGLAVPLVASVIMGICGMFVARRTLKPLALDTKLDAQA